MEYIKNFVVSAIAVVLAYIEPSKGLFVGLIIAWTADFAVGLYHAWHWQGEKVCIKKCWIHLLKMAMTILVYFCAREMKDTWTEMLMPPMLICNLALALTSVLHFASLLKSVGRMGWGPAHIIRKVIETKIPQIKEEKDSKDEA